MKHLKLFESNNEMNDSKLKFIDMFNDNWEYEIELVEFANTADEEGNGKIKSWYYADKNNFTGLLVTIRHNFFADSDLTDFKDFLKISNEVNLIIDRALKSGIISEVGFTEKSNSEISFIVKF